MILVGWSLGGVFAREVAKVRPELVAKVVTMGSPFSGDPRSNNVWRLYEWIAGHPVDKPPIDTDTAEKPPVPTLALWSRKDGIVSIRSTRGLPGGKRPAGGARLLPYGLRRERTRGAGGGAGDQGVLRV